METIPSWSGCLDSARCPFPIFSATFDSPNGCTSPAEVPSELWVPGITQTLAAQCGWGSGPAVQGGREEGRLPTGRRAEAGPGGVSRAQGPCKIRREASPMGSTPTRVAEKGGVQEEARIERDRDESENQRGWGRQRADDAYTAATPQTSQVENVSLIGVSPPRSPESKLPG